jgi:leucyl aminopeptidase
LDFENFTKLTPFSQPDFSGKDFGMKTTGTNADQMEFPFGCIAVGVDSNGQLGSTAARLDEKLSGYISRAVLRNQVSGSRFDLTLLPSPSSDAPEAILVVGLGDPESIDQGVAFQLGAAIARRLGERRTLADAIQQAAIAMADFVAPRQYREFVAGTITGTVGQGLHQTVPKIFPPGELLFLGCEQEVVDAGRVIGESINITRYLVNEPANIIYPESFAKYAKELAEKCGIECEIWDRDRLAKENYEAILAVGQASQHEPLLLIMKYEGGEAGQAPLALVGKGVTFDSGGLSLKPSDSMMTMKCDMAGAATVVGTMAAIANLKLKKNVIGFCGLAENMIAGNAYRLGDVVKTRSGKTVEIHNTDAEGRVVLADVLNVAFQHAPSAIVDLATLTGACVVALGNDVCGLFTNDAELVERVRMAAEVAGEPVWELPMFDFFGEQIRSKVADIKNVGDGRWGGAITAAKFLEEFVEKTPWVHIDIAGPAFADSPKPYRDAGGTGVMVRTLIQWIETESQ